MDKSTLQAIWFRVNVQLSRKEKLIFAKYLSVLLGAGLAIDESIDVLQKQTKGSLARILAHISVTVKHGETLATGLGAFPHVFSPLFINLVASGEASGNLQGNLMNVVGQLEKEYELNSKIRGALMYPAIIMVVAGLIGAGIFVFVLPNVIDMFESLDVELPLATRLLITVATFVSEHGVLTVLIGLATVSSIFIVRKIAFFDRPLHGILLLVPLIGGIAKKVNLARFTRSLGTMVQSGIPIDEAVTITENTLDNVHYKRIFDELKEAIKLGDTLSSVLEKHPRLVPAMATHVIFVGEQAGSLGDMLMYLAKFYEQEVSDITKNLSELLEPFLLIFIGVMVGGLALAVMTPIYEVI
ncbi:MAG: type II secretion system F family protein, partial [Candidatus Kaiserbacteria bacterium]|nr:type II secretion system F family protein [Candidatus Kaiserbacteria bacterium]